MENRTTVFHRPTETGARTGFGLPPDLLQKSRRRIRIVALLVVVGAGADLLLMLLDLLFHMTKVHPLRGLLDALPLASNSVTVLLSVALIVATRRDGLRDRLLMQVALGYEVFLAFTISISNPLSVYQDTGAMPAITWVTPLIILFPLIVPCPPRLTLITAIAAAAMRPLGVLILAGAGLVPLDADVIGRTVFSPVLAVVFAYFGSRVVYGLGIEVAEARRLGSYELVRLLGSGGMGEVWVARHRLLARPAAVKLIRPALIGMADGDGEAQQRFEREAQAIASMRSPHTIGLYDFGVAADGTFYYVMELLEGFDADALVRRFGPVPPARAIHFLTQMCHSLAEAHRAGLVHRDIKPANVYVCRYGLDADFVKVLDFGLVRRTSARAEDVNLTAEDVVTGTPAFMAPEQAHGPDHCDARSDIYAVGCVAYWLLTGKLVFEGASVVDVLLHHVRTAPAPPSTRTGQPIPEALDRLVLSCLEKDQARRPQSAAMLAEMLAACGGERWPVSAAQAWWSDHTPEAGASA